MKPIKFQKNRVRRTYRGGSMLDAWQQSSTCTDSDRPEEWIASSVLAINNGKSVIEHEGLSVTEDGISLRDLIAEHPVELLGKQHVARYGPVMGVLTKALDACERLSIQVHPDREAARRLFQSEYGKTEAWYILGGRTIDGCPPCIYAGFQPGISADRWESLFHKQDIPGMLECLEKIPVQPGEVYLLRGGVPHAIGAGCFLIEIQEPTDYTIRTERTTVSGDLIPDLLCHQGLGFERMFECFHFGNQEPPCRLLPYPKVRQGPAVITPLVTYRDTTAFAMEEWYIDGEIPLPCNGIFFLLICISGDGVIRTPGEEDILLGQGEAVLVPAECEDGYIRGDHMRVLRCLPPCVDSALV